MEIKNTVLHAVSQLSAVPQEQICPADTLSSVGIHSIKTVELIVEDLDPENLTSVEDVISLAERYKGR